MSAPDTIEALALELFMAGGISNPFKPSDIPTRDEIHKFPHARVKYTARRIREFIAQRSKDAA